jgi:hypothetical protein
MNLPFRAISSGRSCIKIDARGAQRDVCIEEHAMQTTLLAIAALTCAVLLGTGAVQAQTYPWCAQYNGDFGGQNCGFSTLRQCRATVSGVGGMCIKNPMFPGNGYQSGDATGRFDRRAWPPSTELVGPPMLSTS